MSRRAADLRADRVPFVHAVVVFAQRPTSAKPGDEAIVFADGTIEGFVGGTCAESTVRAQSLALLDSGEPLLLRITAAAESDSASVDNRLTVHNPCLSGGTLEIFLEPVIPAPLLLIHGDSPIATALARLADRLGYDVSMNEAGDPARAAAVVCASHGRDEQDVLRAALTAGVEYVGLVASRKRGESVAASLDVDEADRARIHTPAGLDIGGHTPEEVALSILAEIVSERRHPTGQPLAEPEVDQTEAVETGTATDPVCGMTVATVETSLHLDHEGVRYWFCGSGCLRAFAADPSGYIAS